MSSVVPTTRNSSTTHRSRRATREKWTVTWVWSCAVACLSVAVVRSRRILNSLIKGWLQHKRTISMRLHAKRYKFENNRRIRSRLPSANLQVTCAPASRSLAPQNPSQLYNNRSLINKHASIWPQTTRFSTRRDYSSLATASARQCSTCCGRDGTIASRSIDTERGSVSLVLARKQKAIARPSVSFQQGGSGFQVWILLTFTVTATVTLFVQSLA